MFVLSVLAWYLANTLFHFVMMVQTRCDKELWGCFCNICYSSLLCYIDGIVLTSGVDQWMDKNSQQACLTMLLHAWVQRYIFTHTFPSNTSENLCTLNGSKTQAFGDFFFLCTHKIYCHLFLLLQMLKPPLISLLALCVTKRKHSVTCRNSLKWALIKLSFSLWKDG